MLCSSFETPPSAEPSQSFPPLASGNNAWAVAGFQHSSKYSRIGMMTPAADFGIEFLEAVIEFLPGIDGDLPAQDRLQLGLHGRAVALAAMGQGLGLTADQVESGVTRPRGTLEPWGDPRGDAVQSSDQWQVEHQIHRLRQRACTGRRAGACGS